MSATAVITTAAATAQTIAAAGRVTKQAIGTVSELMNEIENLKDKGVTSLSQYAKRTLITSRVYVEDQLATEDVTPKLLKLLNSIYSGFVMCAVGLNNLCADGRTIRQMTAAIATENYSKFLDLMKNFGDEVVATEDNKNNPEKKDDNKENKDGNEKNQKNGENNSTALPKEAELKADSQRLFTGHLLEMRVPAGNNQYVPLYFYVQLIPTVCPQPVMAKFLEAHTSPTLTLRWAMWKAGEISFWKDLVFEADRVSKRKKALKADKDGILREIEDHRAKMLKQKLANYKTKEAQARQRNLCNSIVVCTKRTIDTVCRDIGINLKSFSQRQTLMEDMFAIMLVVVDTNYGTIDLYMNGIDARGEYTSKMIEATSKNGGDAIGMKELLAVMSAGGMPKF